MGKGKERERQREKIAKQKGSVYVCEWARVCVRAAGGNEVVFNALDCSVGGKSISIELSI